MSNKPYQKEVQTSLNMNKEDHEHHNLKKFNERLRASLKTHTGNNAVQSTCPYDFKQSRGS